MTTNQTTTPWMDWSTGLERARQLWETTFAELGFESLATLPYRRRYPVEVSETDGAFIVEAELPGFARDDIDVRLENRTLSIAASRPAQRGATARLAADGRHALRRELQDSVRLPSAVVPAGIASLDRGILTVQIPKAPETRTHRIPIDAPATTSGDTTVAILATAP